MVPTCWYCRCSRPASQKSLVSLRLMRTLHLSHPYRAIPVKRCQLQRVVACRTELPHFPYYIATTSPLCRFYVTSPLATRISLIRPPATRILTVRNIASLNASMFHSFGTSTSFPYSRPFRPFSLVMQEIIFPQLLPPAFVVHLLLHAI